MRFWKPMNRDKTLKLILTAACLAGGFGETTGQETAEPEMLEVHYTKPTNSTAHTMHVMQVEKDVEVLRFENLTNLTLLEGLTKLHTLEVDLLFFEGERKRLKLPKDLAKDAEWTFRLVISRLTSSSVLSLAAHKDMGRFLLFLPSGRRGGDGAVPTRIPAAKELIRNRLLTDDGVFRIDQADHHYLGVGVIEVYGFPPKMKITIRRNGIDVRCCEYEGILQSAPTINGPWKDVQPVRVHTLRVRRNFLRSSSPAEFFRVKPEAHFRRRRLISRSNVPFDPSAWLAGRWQRFCGKCCPAQTSQSQTSICPACISAHSRSFSFCRR